MKKSVSMKCKNCGFNHKSESCGMKKSAMKYKRAAAKKKLTVKGVGKGIYKGVMEVGKVGAQMAGVNMDWSGERKAINKALSSKPVVYQKPPSSGGAISDSERRMLTRPSNSNWKPQAMPGFQGNKNKNKKRGKMKSKAKNKGKK